jgi:hypothetical protein
MIKTMSTLMSKLWLLISHWIFGGSSSSGVPREPMGETGIQWVERTLQISDDCYDMFPMRRTVFRRLHDTLVSEYGLVVEMAKRAARPGFGEVRPVLGPAHQAWLENLVVPSKPVGSISCPSPARSRPKWVGSARLARKNGPKSGLSGPISTF